MNEMVMKMSDEDKEKMGSENDTAGSKDARGDSSRPETVDLAKFITLLFKFFSVQTEYIKYKLDDLKKWDDFNGCDCSACENERAAPVPDTTEADVFPEGFQEEWE